MVSSFSTMAWQGLAMASLVSAGVVDLATRQAGASCPSLHIMAAGGCALPCTTDGLGLLSTTVAGISAAIPGSDLYLVPYDGAAAQAAVSTPLLVQAIEQYVQQCPNTPIALVGYSLGGIVVTNALCGALPYEKNIIASITYGEETFSYPQSYDRGTCRASAPKYARTNTAGCQKFAPVMHSYCDAQDPNCCTGGTELPQHFVYAREYDADAVAFVASQYRAFAGTLPSTTSSSSSSSISSSSFPNAPYYPNATIPTAGMSSPVAPGSGPQTSAPGAPSAPAGPAGPKGFTQTTTYTSAGTSETTVITETIVVTQATTIPLYQPTGITTPSITTTGANAATFVPLSAVVESAPAATGVAYTVVAVGSSSGVAIAPTMYPIPSVYPVGPESPQPGGPASPVGTGAPFNSTGGLTPFNPGNGASSMAMPGMLSAVAMLALGLLL